MNAFQIGVVTFRWDAKRSQYTSRPFNVYVWPHSDIIEDRVTRFKASNLKFLVKHHFDFNKLFVEGVNYQRLSNEALIKQKIELRPEFQIIQSVSNMKNHEGLHYNTQRAFTSIGSTSRTSLEDYIRKVANFAVLAQNSDDWPVLEIKIDSYALRRKLSQELQAIYNNRNMIFTNFSKASPIFTVRKYKPSGRGREREAEDVVKAAEVKVNLNELDDSVLDRIVKGERAGVTVLYEDEKVIAFAEKKPVAKIHFIVAAKDKRLSSLQKVQEGEDEGLLGHMMLTVAKVARQCEMSEGYRVVTDSGRNCGQTVPNLCMHVIGGQQLKWPPTEPVVADEEEQKAQIEESKSEVLGQINP